MYKCSLPFMLTAAMTTADGGSRLHASSTYNQAAHLVTPATVSYADAFQATIVLQHGSECCRGISSETVAAAVELLQDVVVVQCLGKCFNIRVIESTKPQDCQ